MPVSKKHVDEAAEQFASEGDVRIQMAPLGTAPSGVPGEWAAALTQSDPVAAVLDTLWKPMAKRLPRTLKALRKTCQGIGLLTTKESPPSLLYFFKQGDELQAYRGFPPAVPRRKEAAKLPQEFLDFYKVHDGWQDLYEAMGPVPSEQWDWLNPESEGPSGKFLVVFNNGGTASLGYDFRKSPPTCHVVWNDDPPEAIPYVWKELDGWIAGQLDDNDAADKQGRAQRGRGPKGSARRLPR